MADTATYAGAMKTKLPKIKARKKAAYSGKLKRASKRRATNARGGY